MENKKLGQEPAFPQCDTVQEALADTNISTFGMSKRFYAACAAMQGILSNESSEMLRLDAREVANMAFDHADKLLKQENE